MSSDRLKEIEIAIDEMDAALDILDSSNPIEAQQIDSIVGSLLTFINEIENPQTIHLSLVS